MLAVAEADEEGEADAEALAGAETEAATAVGTTMEDTEGEVVVGDES